MPTTASCLPTTVLWIVSGATAAPVSIGAGISWILCNAATRDAAAGFEPPDDADATSAGAVAYDYHAPSRYVHEHGTAPTSTDVRSTMTHASTGFEYPSRFG